MVNTELIERIERIEFQVELIKKGLKNKPVRMKGRLKDIKIDEEDFKEAEGSVFKAW